MFLFMIPVDVGTPAPIDHSIPATIVVVPQEATHDGKPVEISDGVTLTMTDGFTVTMSAEDAVVASVPVIETKAEYNTRLCLDYAEAKPWLNETCK